MSQRIIRPSLVVMLIAFAALGACASPTAPTRSSLKPGVRSADLCVNGGWVGSSGKC